MRDDDTLTIDEDMQELIDGKFNSIKTMQLEDPSKKLVLPGLDSNGEMSLFTIANPRGSKLGHETGCCVYKTLETGDFYKDAGLIALSIQVERPCDRSRDVVHAAGDNAIYIDVIMYLIMPFGDHPAAVVQWVIEVKPAVWAEIQKAVNTQLPDYTGALREEAAQVDGDVVTAGCLVIFDAQLVTASSRRSIARYAANAGWFCLFQDFTTMDAVKSHLAEMAGFVARALAGQPPEAPERIKTFVGAEMNAWILRIKGQGFDNITARRKAFAECPHVDRLKYWQLIKEYTTQEEMHMQLEFLCE